MLRRARLAAHHLDEPSARQSTKKKRFALPARADKNVRAPRERILTVLMSHGTRYGFPPPPDAP